MKIKTHSIENLDENEALFLPHSQKRIICVIKHIPELCDIVL